MARVGQLHVLAILPKNHTYPSLIPKDNQSWTQDEVLVPSHVP